MIPLFTCTGRFKCLAIRSAACWCPLASPLSTQMLCMMGVTTERRDAATTAQSSPSTCRATACACSAPTTCACPVLVLWSALSSGALLVLACMCMSTCIHTSIYPHVIHTLQHAATECAGVHVYCTCAYMHVCMCMYVECRHLRGWVAHQVLSCETFLLQSLGARLL